MSIGKKAAKGFISLLYRGVLEKLIGLVAMLILARQLSPYDFGLVSITEVLLVLISVLGTTGLSEFLLAYRKEDGDEIFKAAFWFSLVVSAGILLLFLISLPLWARTQHDPRIVNIGIISGMIFVVSQLQALPKVWFNKHLMFDKLVKIQTPFIILVPIAKVIAVYIGLGVYSLVIPTLLLQPILTVILFRVAGIHPGWKLYRDRWAEIYRYTRHLIGTSVLSRITDQGDKIILAKVLGLDKLGIYNIASQMADLLITQLVMFSNNILSSVLPKYADDKDKFYSHYMGFLKTFAFFVFPVLITMLLSARPIILLLYGPKWEAAVLPMQILLVYSCFRSVTSSYGAVMNSFHLNKKSFVMTLVYTPFHLVGSLVGSFYGVTGLALSVLLVKSVFVNWNIKQIMTAVSRPFALWYRDMGPYFFSAVIIGLLLLGVLVNMPFLDTLPHLVLIAIIGTSFCSVYYLVFRFVFPRELKTVSQFMDLTFPKAGIYFKHIFSV